LTGTELAEWCDAANEMLSREKTAAEQARQRRR
jgi:hypothetical protein